MIFSYWDFISRDLPSNGQPTAIEVIPEFLKMTLVWSTFFSILHILFPIIAKSIFPKWFESLSERDRKDVGSYIVCTVHHLVMVPIAWYHIFNDTQLTQETALLVSYPHVEAFVAPFVIGYLVGDTLCYAIPEMIGLRFEYIIHHILTLYLIITALIGPGYFCRYIPHLIICDTTNIFFNTAWLLRRCGFKNSGIVTALEVMFAVVFLVARVVNLPLIFLQAMRHPGIIEWGFARFTMVPIVLMQWYWFSKILAGMKKKLFPQTASSKQSKRS